MVHIQRKTTLITIAYIVCATLLVLQPSQRPKRIQKHLGTMHVAARAPNIKKHKILTYITTHLSDQHRAFLQQCWPALLRRLPLFQQSDFMMFITNNKTYGDDAFIDSVFGKTGINVVYASNPGYQAGAILALVEGFQHGWFQEYDWVVRVNPDVLIKNDSSILVSMADVSVSGIFVDCLDRPCPAGRGCSSRHIHTDFFAIRPSSVPLEAVLYTNETNAERMAIKAFSGIVKVREDAWLPGTGPQRGDCRVKGAASPVVHDHDLSSCNA